MNNIFSEIKVGMSLQNVVAIMGCPDIAENFGIKYSGLTYKDSEFLFENGKLMSKKSYQSKPSDNKLVGQQTDFVLKYA